MVQMFWLTRAGSGKPRAFLRFDDAEKSVRAHTLSSMGFSPTSPRHKQVVAMHWAPFVSFHATLRLKQAAATCSSWRLWPGVHEIQ